MEDNISEALKIIVDYCHTRECKDCIYDNEKEGMCDIHNPSAWKIDKTKRVERVEAELFGIADELFEKLHYCKSRDENNIYYHNLSNDCVIQFDLIMKSVSIYDYETELRSGMTMEELEAVNAKCKELVWI